MLDPDPTCPECGRDLADGQAKCACGYSPPAREEEETATLLEPSDDNVLPEDVEALPPGPWETMNDAGGATQPVARPAPRRRVALLIVVIVLHLVVIGLIVALLTRPQPPAARQRIVEKHVGPSRVFEHRYVAPEGSPERAVEEALVRAKVRNLAALQSIGLSSDAVSVHLRIEGVSADEEDLPAFRREIGADAVAILRAVFAAAPAAERATVRVEARMGGERGTEWVDALDVACDRKTAAGLLKGGEDPAEALHALNARWGGRLGNRP